MSKSQEVADTFEFPALLRGIITAWRENGHITAEEIAKKIGIENSNFVRAFATRSKSAYRSDNSLVKKLSEYLDQNLDDIRPYIGERRYQQYRMMRMTGEDKESKFHLYPRREVMKVAGQSSSEAFCSILYDYFGSDEEYARKKSLPIIDGRYYCYRTSSYGNGIVKSYMSIMGGKDRFPRFEYIHPDRHQKTVIRKKPAPRKIDGVVVSVGEHFFLIGNAGADQGIAYFVLRKPYSYSFSVLLGFSLMPTTGKTVTAAKSIWVQDESASPEGIGRIAIEEKTDDDLTEELGFNVNIIKKDLLPFKSTTITDMDMINL